MKSCKVPIFFSASIPISVATSVTSRDREAARFRRDGPGLKPGGFGGTEGAGQWAKFHGASHSIRCLPSGSV
jgi:hypothetical protein